jgi:hypothetical protein
MDLLTPYTRLGTTSNYSAIANLHTLQFTDANTKSSPACTVFNSRFLVTDVNSWDSSFSRAQVLLVQRISRNRTPSIPNSTIAPSLLSLTCWAQQNCQPSNPSIPSESESESELLYPWRFTARQFVLATSLLRLTTSNFIFQLNICSYSPYVTSSMTRGWVCRLQLLLVFASAVILRPESRGTHDHILLSQIRHSANLEDQGPLIYIPQEQGDPVTPPGIGFHYRRLLRFAGLRWRYWTPPPQLAWSPRYIASGRTQNTAFNSFSIVMGICRSVV